LGTANLSVVTGCIVPVTVSHRKKVNDKLAAEAAGGHCPLPGNPIAWAG